jgi:arylsulfatase A-like enzyme
VVDRSLEVLELFDEDRPTFLWVHVFDPHAPFEAPVQRLDPRGARAHFQGRVEPSELFAAALLVSAYVGYEAEVAYTDGELGRLFEAWDRRARGPRSVVAVTSDHGEGLGEHGYLGHGLYLYEEQLHVPLLLRATGRLGAGARVAEPSSMVDLGATLLGLCAPDAAGALPGADLTALLRGGEARPVVAERPYYSEWDLSRPERDQALRQHPDRGHGRGSQVALREGDWKFLWSSDVEPELYDLAGDPAESVNLAAQQAERLSPFGERLDAWRAALAPAAETRELDDAGTLEMLEALGYR